MSEEYEGGVYFYLGRPRFGKTTLAREHACADVVKLKRPLGVLDPASAKNLRDFPLAKDADEFIDRVWKERVHSRIIPRSPAEIEYVFKFMDGDLARSRQAIILFDEVGMFARGSRVERIPSLVNVCRHYAHAGAAVIRCTTQYVSDIAPSLLETATELHVFRVQTRRGRLRLYEEFEFDRAKLKTLPKGESIRWSVDDDVEDNSAKDDEEDV